MTTAPSGRISSREAAILKHLALHCGAGGAVVLKERHRAAATSLWRQMLVEIWYRQSSLPGAGLQGPFYKLTERGLRLAASMFTERQAYASRDRVQLAAPSGPAQPKESNHEGSSL